MGSSIYPVFYVTPFGPNSAKFYLQNADSNQHQSCWDGANREREALGVLLITTRCTLLAEQWGLGL